MDVSIIIVSYNTCSLLKDCIRSIYTHTKDVEFEVIVVDNASKDDSCEMLSREFPKVQVICSPENLGFGRANNLGIRIAKGKYLFFLNSDTLFLNNALKFFFDYSESSAEKIGALGAILKAPSGENCHSYGRFITMKSELQDLVAKYLRFLKKKEYQYPANIKQAKCVDYITGADLWVPKAVYEKVGGFDPAFFMYCEEVDWQKRMADSGLLRLIIPGPEIIHLEGGSDANGGSRIWSPNRLEMFFASKKIYFRKHFNRIAYIPFRILYVLLRIPIILVLSIVKRGGVRSTPQEDVKRATRVRSLRRFRRLFWTFLADNLPLTMSFRSLVYRRIGIKVVGEGKILTGKLKVDAIHPEDVYIGSGTTLTNGCVLLTHFYDVSNLQEHAYYRGEIHIGRNCYVGTNTIFAKPVTIGDGVVIGAGSVVTKDIPSYQVWAGVPARFIRNRYGNEAEIPPSLDEFKAY